MHRAREPRVVARLDAIPHPVAFRQVEQQFEVVVERLAIGFACEDPQLLRGPDAGFSCSRCIPAAIWCEAHPVKNNGSSSCPNALAVLAPSSVEPLPSNGHRRFARPCSLPDRSDALRAVRTLLAWVGEDADRPGLRETPDRVLRAYGELFAGYGQDPAAILAKTFDEVADYDGPVVVKDIEFSSHCEHHMVPFRGLAHIAYLPDRRVVGLSKLARLVDVFARRLQIQERLTAQIAQALDSALRPRGVAVVIEAEHHCMTMRGVRKDGARTITASSTGMVREDPTVRAEIMALLRP